MKFNMYKYRNSTETELIFTEEKGRLKESKHPWSQSEDLICVAQMFLVTDGQSNAQLTDQHVQNKYWLQEYNPSINWFRFGFRFELNEINAS